MAEKDKTQDTSNQNNVGMEKNFIKEAINDFISEIESLHVSYPYTMRVLLKTTLEKLQIYKKYFKKYGKKNRSNQLYIEEPYTLTAKELTSEIDTLLKANKILPENYLIALVSAYDNHINKLLKILYRLRPELYENSSKTIEFSGIKEMKTMDEVKEYIIEKETEAISRKSHLDQFKALEAVFSMSLTSDIPNWTKFIELTERRNLFVHCGGIVSSQYLKVCRENKVFDKYLEPKLGEKLEMDSKYFHEALECLLEIGVKLSHVLWRKLFPEELELAEENFNEDVCFSLLKKKRYKLVISLLSFATETAVWKFAKEANRKVSIINKALAYKFDKNNEKAIEIIDKEDWTASDDQFRMAIAIIKEDYVTAGIYMKLLCESGRLRQSSYLDWPLFTDFRKTKIFLQTYKQAFKRSFKEMEKISNFPRLVDKKLKAD